MCSGMVYNQIEMLTSTVSLSGFRIFAHNDKAGQAASDRWTEQLKEIATVDRLSFRAPEMSDGQPVKDLNDLLRISSDSDGRNAKEIDGVMRF
jgi:hypothetical protein